jgi:hypothetical protein
VQGAKRNRLQNEKVEGAGKKLGLVADGVLLK